VRTCRPRVARLHEADFRLYDFLAFDFTANFSLAGTCTSPLSACSLSELDSTARLFSYRW
jgi:hypothetical protein